MNKKCFALMALLSAVAFAPFAARANSGDFDGATLADGELRYN